MAVTISFQGLCAFRPVSIQDGVQGWQVIMAQGHGNHMPRLSTGISPGAGQIENEDGTTWLPDSLGFVTSRNQKGDPIVQQVATWNLDKLNVTMEAAAGPSTVAWPDKKKAIEMEALHAGLQTKPTAAILKMYPNAAIFTISSGELSTRALKNYTFTLNGAADPPREVGEIVTLTVEGPIKLRQGDRVIQVLADADLWISNVAPVTDGNAHFSHYYDFTNHNGARYAVDNLNLPYWDCIPPASLP